MYRMLMSATAVAALLVSVAGCSPVPAVQAQPVAPGVVAVEAPQATYYAATPTPEYSQPLPHYAMLPGPAPSYYGHRRHCHCYGYHHRHWVHHYRHHRHHYHCAAAAQADAEGMADGACNA